jgi:hypothetical protein
VRSKDKALAAAAVRRLAQLGTVVRANLPVVDLGTPVSCGTRRLANQAHKRLASAKGRSARVEWLAGRNRKAVVLAKTGIIPAISWGGPAFGTPPSLADKQRHVLSSACAAPGGKGCPLATVAIRMGPKFEPWTRSVVEQVTHVLHA